MCYVRIALCHMIWSFLSCFSRLFLLSAPRNSRSNWSFAEIFLWPCKDMWRLCENYLLQRGHRINFSMDQVLCTCLDSKTKAGRNKCKCGHQLVYRDALTCNCEIFAVTAIIRTILLACSTFRPKMIMYFTKKCLGILQGVVSLHNWCLRLCLWVSKQLNDVPGIIWLISGKGLRAQSSFTPWMGLVTSRASVQMNECEGVQNPLPKRRHSLHHKNFGHLAKGFCHITLCNIECICPENTQMSVQQKLLKGM